MGIQERKEREKERRKQQIIVAAKRVFSAKGFNRSTMEDIAKEAELSPGTIYIYFKNKDDLYASLSLRVLKHLNIKFEHVKNEKNISHDKRVNHLKEALYDVYKTDPLILINMFRLQSSETLKNLSDDLLMKIKDLSRNSHGTMAKIFEQGIRDGAFIEQRPIALADILWSLFSGIILWEESKRSINNEKNYLTPTLQTGFEIFINGITRHN